MFNSSINNKLIQEYLITYILGGTTVYITFTFMHLADAFIQSDLQCIQVIHVLSACVFPGNWTHNLCAANAMLYHRSHRLHITATRQVFAELACFERIGRVKVSLVHALTSDESAIWTK